jgi:hypothetical protein
VGGTAGGGACAVVKDHWYGAGIGCPSVVDAITEAVSRVAGGRVWVGLKVNRRAVSRVTVPVS